MKVSSNPTFNLPNCIHLTCVVHKPPMIRQVVVAPSALYVITLFVHVIVVVGVLVVVTW